MKARAALKNCLNCKRAIECWKLDNGCGSLNPEKHRITFRSRLRIAIELITHKPTLREFHVMCVAAYVEAMSPRNSPEQRIDISQTSILVTEGLVNSAIDRWECPEEFGFVPRDEELKKMKSRTGDHE